MAASGTSPKRAPDEHEGDEDRLQEERADEDVAVDARHAAEAVGGEDARAVAPVAAQERVAAEPEAHREARPFGEEGGDRHARHAPAEAEDEPEVEDDVDPVHHELDHEHRAGAFVRDEPAGDAVDRDERGRGPDADAHVGAGERLDLVRGGGDQEGAAKSGHCSSDDRAARGEGDEERAGEERVGLGPVARADGLAREARGAHAEEAEDPVEPGQDDRAEAHGADGGGLAQLPHDGGVDGAEDRDGGVRDDDGDRDPEHAGVRERAGVSRHGRA